MKYLNQFIELQFLKFDWKFSEEQLNTIRNICIMATTEWLEASKLPELKMNFPSNDTYAINYHINNLLKYYITIPNKNTNSQ